MDAQVCKKLTEAVNERRTELTITQNADYSYDFDLKDMQVAEYFGRRKTSTYELRVVLVLMKAEE